MWLRFFMVVCLGLEIGCIHRTRLKPFAGCWRLERAGKNVMLLQLNQKGGHLQGTLRQPKMFTEYSDGHFENISPDEKTRRVRSLKGKYSVIAVKGKYTVIVLRIGDGEDREHVHMKLLPSGRASIDWFRGEVPDLVFSNDMQELCSSK